MGGVMFFFKFTRIIILGVIFSLMINSAAWAQFDNIPDLTVESFTEKIDEIQPISGTGVKGLLFNDESDFVSPHALYIKLNQDLKNPIKVHLKTPDGNYIAEWRVVAQDNDSGWARLPYSSAQSKRLKEYLLTEVGVLATDANGRYLPMRWTKAETSTRLTVFINSEGKEAYFVERINGKPSKSQCEEITRDPRINIDKVCHVDLQTAVLNDGNIEIRRREGLTRLASLIVKFND